MYWSTINFKRLCFLLLPTFLRKSKILAVVNSCSAPMQRIADETLYKMQHNGAKIYLEKMLNESFAVANYDHQNHEATKKIYIDDLPKFDKLYIYQDGETEVSFLEDDDIESPDDVFLEGDNEGVFSYSWIIFMPDTITFDEISLRALVDSYRYIGKKHIIEIYSI